MCSKPVHVAFDGGRLTSDAGALLLGQVERRLGIAERLAKCIEDPRDPAAIQHSVAEMIRFRALLIACGYPDANDCNEVRRDPAFKMAVDRLPESGRDLCSQSTMTRLENDLVFQRAPRWRASSSSCEPGLLGRCCLQRWAEQPKVPRAQRVEWLRRVRIRRDLLASAARLASSRRVGPSASRVTASAAGRRPRRLEPCLRGQFVYRREKGGAATGPNPTDRGRPGTKRHLITDRRGIPLALILTGANVHDSVPFEDLLDAVPPVSGKRGRPRRRPNKLHADKAYDHRRCRRACHRRQMKPRIARRGLETGQNSASTDG